MKARQVASEDRFKRVEPMAGAAKLVRGLVSLCHFRLACDVLNEVAQRWRANRDRHGFEHGVVHLENSTSLTFPCGSLAC